ncbi:hypothetical protein DY000_02019242 [Brassica cretica]|uniref:Uncharacterized protein n=1 Tax=Brassica cretica TaxID=69181 RepID=A0ABQ7D810_BRACR|nr:hypothetical protein DY000_02019242 [Brassica cretica]
MDAICILASNLFPTDMSLQLFLREDASMHQHLRDLCLGRSLKNLGSQRDTPVKKLCGHIPPVCPYGAVVVYAWKSHLVGQAGAYSVDRTRFHVVANELRV